MHRPAPADVDAQFGRALREAPSSSGRRERLKRALAEEDDAGGAGGAGRARASSRTSAAVRRVQAGRPGAPGRRRADAYWRQRTWKRVAVILAGPADEPRLRDRPLRDRLHDRRRAGRRRPSASRRPGQAGSSRSACGRATEILAINGQPVTSADLTERIRASQGQPLTLRGLPRRADRQSIGPVRAVKIDERRLPARLHAQGRAAGRRQLASLKRRSS